MTAPGSLTGQRLRRRADVDAAIGAVMHDRGQQRAAIGGAQHFRPVLRGKGGDGVGRAEIDADGKFGLLGMGIGRGTRLVDLQQVHARRFFQQPALAARLLTQLAPIAQPRGKPIGPLQIVRRGTPGPDR